jgi:hypothetical protein
MQIPFFTQLTGPVSERQPRSPGIRPSRLASLTPFLPARAAVHIRIDVEAGNGG